LKTYTKFIDELDQNLKKLHLKNDNIYYISEQGVKLCEDALNKLRLLVLANGFSTPQKEMVFYKVIKPNILSKLIYFVENFNIESNRPKTSIKSQTKYLNNYIETFQNYFHSHQEFYNYYKGEATHLDEQYFLSKNTKVSLNKEAYHFFTDKAFSSTHCTTVAIIMAYEKLIVKLKQDINKLKTGISMDGVYKAFQKESNLNWTGSKTDLVELIYALHSVGAINNGTVDIKETAKAFEQFFNIDLGNYY
jgi:hypothetical protein